jgi:mycothione reductase
MTTPGGHYDLIIIGTGSGNSIIGPEMDGWRIAVVERFKFGGTCLNHGCIPTKMFVYAADLARHAAQHDGNQRYGIRTQFLGADWPAIRDRVFGRIDPIEHGGRTYRQSLPNVDCFEASARCVGDRTIEVAGTRITGDRIVIAAGCRPQIPDIPGLDATPFHTSDTIMRIDALPEHLIILGGGFIACELAHVMGALGAKVTIVNRGTRLLRGEDDEVSQRFTELASQHFDTVLGATVTSVRSLGDRVVVDVTNADGQRVIEGDCLLVATGRISNADQLEVAASGIRTDSRGFVQVDEFGRTSVPGVWALGDINGRHQLKHMANGEARVVRHNLLHPDDLQVLDPRPAPHAVFSSPQIASVGLTEAQAKASGAPYCVAVQEYAGSAYGWAMEDTTSFCKLVGDPVTRRLLGAHVIGAQASLLVQPLVQGLHLGTSVDDLATGQVWIHPALAEVNEVALLKLVEAFDALV